MANGEMLVEMRKLTEGKSISDHAFKRLTLAAVADIVENQEEDRTRYDKLEVRVTKTEKKITYLARAELIITGVFGIIIAKIKGV